MTTPRYLLAGILLGTMLGGSVAAAAERDSRGLAEALAKRLKARREASRIHTTDFQGTDLGCIVLPRFELRQYGYPGHAFLCEAAVSGEVLGGVLNKKGRMICDIFGAFVDDGANCYDFSICETPETLCIVD